MSAPHSASIRNPQSASIRNPPCGNRKHCFRRSELELRGPQSGLSVGPKAPDGASRADSESTDEHGD
eukprot:11364045-Alexandrium_andersonii.AAC.1